MYRTITLVEKYCSWYCSKLPWQIHGTVALARSEPSDLDRMTNMRLNSQYCSYSDKIERIQIHFNGMSVIDTGAQGVFFSDIWLVISLLNNY
jgi:hypothetical protein